MAGLPRTVGNLADEALGRRDQAGRTSITLWLEIPHNKKNPENMVHPSANEKCIIVAHED